MNSDNKDDFADQVRSGKNSSLAREFFDLICRHKKWWLAPILVMVLLLSALMFLGGSGAAPFIYTLF